MPANAEREPRAGSLQVAGDEKGTLSAARRRKR